MLGKVLADYEDLNLTNYLDYYTSGLIFNHQENAATKEHMERM